MKDPIWESPPHPKGGPILVIFTLKPENAPACVVLAIGGEEVALDPAEAKTIGERLIDIARSIEPSN